MDQDDINFAIDDTVFIYHHNDEDDAILLRTCPYKSELFHDHTTLCACNAAKRKQCCEDI
jgi:hypothetical protein